MGFNITLLGLILGIIVVGFTTGIVIAQEVEVGANAGTPFVKFDDQTSPGNQYEIRLNDGNGLFQVYDLTNDRSAFVVRDNGNVGVGADDNPPQDFTIGCTTGVCNIQTRAFAGDAANTVKALGDPAGEPRFRLWNENWSGNGRLIFDIMVTDPDGELLFRNIKSDNSIQPIFTVDLDPDGGSLGRVTFLTEVHDSSGCVMNCP